MISTSTRLHHHGDAERQVALGARPCWPPPRRRASEARLPLKLETMVGSVLSSVMKPPAATAPAPICLT